MGHFDAWPSLVFFFFNSPPGGGASPRLSDGRAAPKQTKTPPKKANFFHVRQRIGRMRRGGLWEGSDVVWPLAAFRRSAPPPRQDQRTGLKIPALGSGVRFIVRACVCVCVCVCVSPLDSWRAKAC